MAREVGFDLYGFGANHERFVGVIKAFEALVRADERERLAKIQFESILQAINIEREACAKVCDDLAEAYEGEEEGARQDGADTCAAAIRAKGTHDH
jgi:hypothetical protein